MSTTVGAVPSIRPHTRPETAHLECQPRWGQSSGLYGIVRLEAHRRQGLATAVTLAALELVRAVGVTHAVLQASADGAPVYEKIGFTSVGTYTEFAL
ncbi:GNAT family N-acetyltransferase [Rhodococcus koreensis]